MRESGFRRRNLCGAFLAGVLVCAQAMAHSVVTFTADDGSNRAGWEISQAQPSAASRSGSIPAMPSLSADRVATSEQASPAPVDTGLAATDDPLLGAAPEALKPGNARETSSRKLEGAKQDPPLSYAEQFAMQNELLGDDDAAAAVRELREMFADEVAEAVGLRRTADGGLVFAIGSAEGLHVAGAASTLSFGYGDTSIIIAQDDSSAAGRRAEAARQATAGPSDRASNALTAAITAVRKAVAYPLLWVMIGFLLVVKFGLIIAQRRRRQNGPHAFSYASPPADSDLPAPRPSRSRRGRSRLLH